MVRIVAARDYLANYRRQYQKLYADDEALYHWAMKRVSLFRARNWHIAPMAGDPWRATYVAPEQAIDWDENSQLDPDESVEPAYRRHLYRLYWQPWTVLLRERNVDRLIFSVYELIGDHEACCAECGLDWEEITEAFCAIEFDIAGACALFSMSDSWAMYCWEGFAILGGTPEFMARYGELAGGWDRVRADFKRHLDGDYDSYNHPEYRTAVERALSGPDAAWSRGAGSR